MSMPLALGTMTACGKKDEKSTTSDAKVPSTMGEVDVKPGTLLIAMDSSISTLGSTLSGPIAGAPAGLRADGEGDIGCDDDTNYPIDLKDPSKNSASGYLTDDDARFGTGRIYCAIANKTDNNESVQGAYFMPKVFACALSHVDDAALDGENHDVTLTATRECFGSLLDDPETGLTEGAEINVVVNATATPAVEGWDLDLKIFRVDEFSYRMLFQEEEGKSLSFTAYSAGSQSFGSDGVAVSVDIEKGELRYAYRRMIVDCDDATGDDLKTCFGKSTDDQWQGTVHNVILAKGTLNASAEFTALDSIAGVTARTFSSSSEPVTYTGYVATLQGTLTGGLTSRTYRSTTGTGDLDVFLTAANFPAFGDATMCWKDEQDPVAGACDGITGLEFTANAQVPYLIHPADTRIKWNKEWIEQKPLDFSTIDLGNVNL